jgi:hypothetical protein
MFKTLITRIKLRVLLVVATFQSDIEQYIELRERLSTLSFEKVRDDLGKVLVQTIEAEESFQEDADSYRQLADFLELKSDQMGDKADHLTNKLQNLNQIIQ